MRYFIDKGCRPSPSTIFVAIDSTSCYCPVGQHSEMASDYIEGCKEISKKEYIEYSGCLYTPADYIM